MSRTYTSDRARFETENIDRSANAKLSWKTKYGDMLEPIKRPVLFRQPPPTASPPRQTSPHNVRLPPPTPPTTNVYVTPCRRHFNMSSPSQRSEFYSSHVGRPTTKSGLR